MPQTGLHLDRAPNMMSSFRSQETSSSTFLLVCSTEDEVFCRRLLVHYCFWLLICCHHGVRSSAGALGSVRNMHFYFLLLMLLHA